MKVYLAGPISGSSYERATEWRKHFTDAMSESCPGVRCLSPMRGKAYLSRLSAVPAEGAEQYGILSGGSAVVARDFSDTTKSDIVVVNLLGASKVSIGTMFEVAWAHSHHVPVVLVIEDGSQNVHSHSMLFSMCGYRVSSLAEAIEIVSAFFN